MTDETSGRRSREAAHAGRSRLILGSASPRRRELLALLGIPFEVVPSGVSEDTEESTVLPGYGEWAPDLLANRLAFQKAWDIAEAVKSSDGAPALILAADTVVSAGPPSLLVVLGKPANADEARGMLLMLSGATHSVYTGVSLIHVSGQGQPTWDSAVVETRVTFRELTPQDIDRYVTTGEPFDKAGAYGIQGHAAAFVESVQGDYYNVVGLPLDHVWRMVAPYFPEVPIPQLPAQPFASNRSQATGR